MLPILRQYQAELLAATEREWAAGARNVMAVSPTGSGKTVIFSEAILRHGGPACAVAHRKELVGQMSLALARNGVRHRIISPPAVIRNIVRIHMEKVGRSYYNPQSAAAVGGIDTIIRMDPTDPWFATIGLAVMDEGHHVLAANKWGRGMDMFLNAKGLFVTAAATRADGKGLGRHHDGLVDALVIGPGMRALIDMKWLTDYRILAPPNDLDLSDVPEGAGGDYQHDKLVKAVRRSRIHGDVVESYIKHTMGKLGITFAVDTEAAEDITRRFNAAGVPAAMVTHETPDLERIRILTAFERRELLQLVNVDLFGEGFDLPAIEVVSMARPTKSFQLFAQQFGRALRLMEGKIWAIILDHVGNVASHGLPDAIRRWTLDRRNKRSRMPVNDVMPTRRCLNLDDGTGAPCMSTYERVLPCCPYCGYVNAPATRGSPEEVDGDLVELTPEILAAMRGEVRRIDGPAPRVPSLDPIAQRALENRHHARQRAVNKLREAIATWGGWQATLDRGESESMKRFFHTFGVDVLSAQTLGATEADKLADIIVGHLEENRIVRA